ncbi:XRE family transcriptional regulator [Mycolicibacterium sp. lyk4-40-TYG-92]|uniref:XRE family transcriptional regulator n=1 Tax=Mycolicibacterium sp. lyk4-40-TYG-92 TaxID=3040295 RepID=UPI002550FB8D|nr:XRE family transcriptional regulator [Mycolicibacterium sp. lyk4-40-TYG-92]
MNVYPDAGRVQQLRSARGLTQAELADALGLPASSLSRVLSGHLSLSEGEAQCLAEALDCSIEVLGRPSADVLHTRPWLRAYADAPKKTVDQYIADTLLALESFNSLRLKQMPERLPMFTGDINDDCEIDEFANNVRQAADVPPHGAVLNVTRAAERLGCLVLPMDSELGKHLGMSMFVDGTPVIRVSRPSAGGGIPGDRQRFTTAHELGHVSLHQSQPPPQTADEARAVENQAHRFAGAFLMPGDSFLNDLDEAGGKVTLTTLSRLKERWGVSVKAMVVRLQQLHRIDADQARSLYKQISSRGWNKVEPIEVGNERAIWLTKAMARRFPGDDPMEDAVRRTGLHRSYFVNWIDWEPSHDATVIPFRRAAGESGAPSRIDATNL